MNLSTIKKDSQVKAYIKKMYDTKKSDRVLISFRYLLTCFKKPEIYEKSQRSFK